MVTATGSFLFFKCYFYFATATNGNQLWQPIQITPSDRLSAVARCRKDSFRGVLLSLVVKTRHSSFLVLFRLSDRHRPGQSMDQKEYSGN